ncbi:MAG: hypothetical protein PVH87_02035 [Desulfobacteraceae bacterium]|jgi:hypothetical protein
MTCLWKFEARIRSSCALFYLDEQIPFFGDYRQARLQAEERKRRWELRNGQLIDHVEPSLRIRPDQRQIPASLLKLAGYAMVSVAVLVCADGHSSHTFIALEKAGSRQSDTIQSRNWKAASNAVKANLTDAKKKGRFDIGAEAYNGVVTQENTKERAFISRMYGPGMDPTCFVFQTFRPATRTTALAINKIRLTNLFLTYFGKKSY